jgi:hypothetical protein
MNLANTPSERFRKRGLSGVLLILLLGSMASGSAQQTRETELKAAFLLNFALFVNWPEHAFTSPEAPLVIGVLGSAGLKESLDAVVAGEQANGRRIETALYETASDAANAHILYFALGVNYREALPHFAGRPVLTVGESIGFTPAGGILRLANERGSFGLRVNLQTARSNHLEISPKLLRLAEICNGEEAERAP